MARDRTSEFVSTIKSIEGKPQWMNNELRSRRSNNKQSNGLNGTSLSSPQYNSYVTFMRGSRLVARDLYSTYQKLEKINHLARKKTIFDDEEASKELNELVYIVKQDINSLNQQIETLRQQQLQAIQQNSNIDSHSKNVILTLQHQLANMSSNFKNTLELRTQVIESHLDG
jgi:syntaxin 5